MGFNIAIDGPAGAGKSSVARKAALKLGYIYVDTGAMYRCIALALHRAGTDIDDEQALEAVLDKITISLSYDEDGTQQVYLNGENVSGLIRTEEVSQMASKSSAKPAVRNKLTDLQRNLAEKENVLMDGRDIGTVILPNADLKIYLTASVEARAMRRYLEQKNRGLECSLDEIKNEIIDRDYRDMHRETAPLKCADDAILLDTSDMSREEVIGRVMELAEERGAVCR